MKFTFMPLRLFFRSLFILTIFLGFMTGCGVAEGDLSELSHRLTKHCKKSKNKNHKHCKKLRKKSKGDYGSKNGNDGYADRDVKGGPGTFSFANYPQGWPLGKKARSEGGTGNERVVTDPEQGKVLEVSYPKGTSSPSDSKSRGLKPGGTGFERELGSHEGGSLTYWMKIPQGFDCVKGGKLPGLASNGEMISGGETADGSNGFSIRMGWQEGCVGHVYAYLPRSENRQLSDQYNDQVKENKSKGILYGWSIGKGEFRYPVGRWVKIGIDIKMNDVGQKNGTMRVTMDGKTVVQRNEVVYRSTPKLKVGTMVFSTFFGGSGREYAATKNEKIYFGDMNFQAK